jgi:hypothetical protein
VRGEATAGKTGQRKWGDYRVGRGKTGQHGQPQPQPQPRRPFNEVSKPVGVGAYAHQRLNLEAKGKAHGRDTKASNRTWEIRPSGIIGGPRKPWPWQNCEPTSQPKG